MNNTKISFFVYTLLLLLMDCICVFHECGNNWLVKVGASIFGNEEYLKWFNPCCIQHDMYYDVCATKSEADEVFRTCLHNACYDNSNGEKREDCLNHAKIWSNLVEQFGGSAYKAACPRGGRDIGSTEL